MFRFLKKENAAKELDRMIADINMNMQNNYKDAAQDGLREFEEKLSELIAQGTLRESQKASYISCLSRCNKNMIGKTTGNTVNSQDLIDKRQYL